MQVIDNSWEAQQQLRQFGTAKSLECLDVLWAWIKMRGHSGLVALQTLSNSGELAAFAVLLSCDLVSQWGLRKSLLLLLPLQAISPSEQQNLLQSACDYAQQNYDSLGLLYFSNKPQIISQLASKYNFSHAWEYVVTVSFPIPEEAVWLLPFQEKDLRYYGGEVELPRILGMLWDCLE